MSDVTELRSMFLELLHEDRQDRVQPVSIFLQICTTYLPEFLDDFYGGDKLVLGYT